MRRPARTSPGRAGRALRPALLAALLLLGSACSSLPVEQRTVVTARPYYYDPATIRVRAGTPVRIDIRAYDRRAYGFVVDGLGLRARVPAGGRSEVRFTPERPGTYTIRNDVDCGAPCRSMRALLIVEPKQGGGGGRTAGAPPAGRSGALR
ncbi:MAG: cupredoxin domain-containing protein [Firmicutes bacterium]|nr:cupredoxin domain-containing protein [Bacillota bacterium]